MAATQAGGRKKNDAETVTGPSVTFVGGAGTVTGSCYWIRHPQGQALVDCGLFQGPKSVKELNYRPFIFDPKMVDAVLLTHAHIDHSGLVPKLWRHGFRGPIVATEATRDLLTYMLPDTGYIQEMEVERLNERRARRGEAPVAPIFTRADAEQSLALLTPKPVGTWIAVAPWLRARLWEAGHLLGSCSIELEISHDGEAPISLLLSGDLGTGDKAFHDKPTAPQGLDYVIVESTYGNRDRPPLSPEARRKALAKEVRAAFATGGKLIIPVFAVERTQELLFDLRLLFDRGDLAPVPVFLDSPLAARATEVFSRHSADLGEAADVPNPFRRPNFHIVETSEQSRQLNRIRSGAIIMAASGMCETGRIRHHLTENLWRADATVLFVGYQAPGTLGRLLVDGTPAVRIMGQEIKVNARIRQLDLYSAHADQGQLVDWVVERMPIRHAVVLSHGEAAAIADLKSVIGQRVDLHCPVLEPALGDSLKLDRSKRAMLVAAAAMPVAAQSLFADSHNEYAAVLLSLSDRLRHAPDEMARSRLLARIRKVLDRPDAPRSGARRTWKRRSETV